MKKILLFLFLFSAAAPAWAADPDAVASGLLAWLDSLKEMPLFQLLNYPFFTLGQFRPSIWLLTKAGIFLWFFFLTSELINKLLTTRVYPRLKMEETVCYKVSFAVKYGFTLLGLFLGMHLVGLNLDALTVIAGTVGIGIGIGLQDVAKNFISGVLLLIEQPIKVGDYIEINGTTGRVRDIKARGTVIDTPDNATIIVPNAHFISDQIVNWSYDDPTVRVTVEVGVAYGSDVDRVKKILLELAAAHPETLDTPAPCVVLEQFGDSALLFKLFVWVNGLKARAEVRSDLNFAVYKRFAAESISIPFPQTEITLKTPLPDPLK